MNAQFRKWYFNASFRKWGKIRQNLQYNYTKSPKLNVFISSCRIRWSQVLSRELICNWSSPDRHILVINNFIASKAVPYIRSLAVGQTTTHSLFNCLSLHVLYFFIHFKCILLVAYILSYTSNHDIHIVKMLSLCDGVTIGGSHDALRDRLWRHQENVWVNYRPFWAHYIV